MKKTMTLSLVLLLTAVFLSCTPSTGVKSGAAAGEALIKLMPKGTMGILAVDIQRAMSTEATAKALQDPKSKEKYDEFVKMSGIDPMKDISYVAHRPQRHDGGRGAGRRDHRQPEIRQGPAPGPDQGKGPRGQGRVLQRRDRLFQPGRRQGQADDRGRLPRRLPHRRRQRERRPGHHRRPPEKSRVPDQERRDGRHPQECRQVRLRLGRLRHPPGAHQEGYRGQPAAQGPRRRQGPDHGLRL